MQSWDRVSPPPPFHDTATASNCNETSNGTGRTFSPTIWNYFRIRSISYSTMAINSGSFEIGWFLLSCTRGEEYFTLPHTFPWTPWALHEHYEQSMSSPWALHLVLHFHGCMQIFVKMLTDKTLPMVIFVVNGAIQHHWMDLHLILWLWSMMSMGMHTINVLSTHRFVLSLGLN